MAKNDSPALLSILDRSGDAATVAWAHEGQGSVAALPDPMLAVAAAERLGNVAALQAVSAPKELRKAAAAALHRLRSRGVEVKEAPAPRSFTLGGEKLDLPSRAFLSLPDSEGDVEVLLTASDDEGHCVLAAIFGGQDLVRECRHAHVNRSELRNLWSTVEARRMHAEVPFVTGLHYADRFLKGHDRHAFDHFLEHVPAGTLNAARILDPLAKLPAPRADEPEAPRWMVPVGLLNLLALQKEVAKLVEIMTSSLYNTDEDRRGVMDAAFAEAADAALDAPARARLDGYLELVVAGALHYGWPKAAAVFEGYRKGIAEGTPGREIPPVFAACQLHIAQTIVQATPDLLAPGDE